MSFQKVKQWRSQNYLKWIKSQFCRVSMQEGCDPHHVAGVLPGAMASKPSDLFTMPITRGVHTDLHNIGKVRWETKHNCNQAEEVLKTINKALEEGVISIIWNGDNNGDY